MMAEETSAPLFSRFVEPGRVCTIRFGPDYGKLAVIVDIIDQRRVLIDGPTTNVTRKSMPLSRICLTDFVVDGARRGVRRGKLVQLLEKDNALERFKQSPFGKRIAAKNHRANMTDFERFKLKSALRRRRQLITAKLAEQQK